MVWIAVINHLEENECTLNLLKLLAQEKEVSFLCAANCFPDQPSQC